LYNTHTAECFEDVVSLQERARIVNTAHDLALQDCDLRADEGSVIEEVSESIWGQISICF
jgi:hypothetical protein